MNGGPIEVGKVEPQSSRLASDAAGTALRRWKVPSSYAMLGAMQSPDLNAIDSLLRRLGAQLSVWQVQALYLGAQASTSFRLGPQHLLDRVLGDDGELGKSIEDANAGIGLLFGFWNHLLDQKTEGTLQLSEIALSDPPTTAELRALAERRAEETLWFIRGMDAGGDDPIEFGPEGQEILRRIAEASAFCKAYLDTIEKQPEHPPEDLRKARGSLEEISTVILGEMIALSEVSDGVRRSAIAEFQAMQGSTTDDGAPIARTVKIGRNQPCPCGSGKKYKRCCGGPISLQ